MGGNLAAVQASRICTHLHLGCCNGDPSNPQYKWNGVIATFWKGICNMLSTLYLHCQSDHSVKEIL